MSISSTLLSGIKTIEFGHQFQQSPVFASAPGNRQDLIEMANAAKSLADIHRVCSLVTRHYGFDYFGFGFLAPTLEHGAVLSYVYNHQSAWTDHYKKCRYMTVDPFAMHCVGRATPRLWSCADGLASYSSGARRMVSDAMDFGMTNLIQIPLHGGQGSVGGIRFSNFRCGRQRMEEIHAITPDVFYICAFLQEAISRIVTSSTKQFNGLTRREQEVLKLAA